MQRRSEAAEVEHASEDSLDIGRHVPRANETRPTSVERGERSTSWLAPWLRACFVLLVVKVTASTMLGYASYFPPDFEAEFLRGREAYFRGLYGVAFYVHLLAGPLSLLLGLVLISDRWRRSAPQWHRRIGRIQVVVILGFLVPSGLWMSWYALTGRVAASGLGMLAVATAFCVARGWQTAVARRIADHRHWMIRTFLLLCSAVVLRLLGGAATVLEFDLEWSYPVAAWLSWLGPLLVFEMWSSKCRVGSR